MSVFVESLKRLFNNEKISEEKIIQMFNENKINEEEKKYILEV